MFALADSLCLHQVKVNIAFLTEPVDGFCTEVIGKTFLIIVFILFLAFLTQFSPFLTQFSPFLTQFSLGDFASV